MIFFISCLISSLLVSNLQASPSNSVVSGRDDICSTASTVFRAGPLSEKTFRDLILDQNMCPNQEPCDNFYEFSCKKAARSPLDDLYEQNNQLIEQLFASEDAIENPSSNLVALNQFLASCKNGNISEETIYELVNGLMSYLSVCPKSENESEEPDTSQSILWLYHQYLASKLGKPLNMKCVPRDQFDWRSAVLAFRNLGLEYEHFFKINMQTKGGNVQFRLTRPILPDLHTNLHYRIILLSQIPVLDYESLHGRIWNVMKLREDIDRLTKPVYNNSHKKEKVYWLRKLSGNEQLADADIDKDEIDLSNLERVIDGAESDVVSDYMIINFMESIKTMKENLAKPGNFCLETLHDKMGLILSSEYSRQFVSPAKLRQVQKLIDELRIDLVSLIDKMDWMSPNVKQQTKSIARSINVVVGFPQEMLQKWIEAPQFDANHDYLMNLVLANKFKYNIQSIMLARIPYAYALNHYSKARKIGVVNKPELNTIFVTWALLGGYFLDETQPQGLNYATIGYLIAREFAHSLDERANSIYSKKTPEFRWDRKTIGDFRILKDCLVDQYTQASHLSVDGESTFVENFADVVGHQLAYRSYNRWLRSEQGRGQSLSNFRFDPKKLFWIMAANLHCPTKSVKPADSKKYSPSEMRTNQPARNSFEFELDFSCPRETQMTLSRPDKCLFWRN